MLKKNEEQIKKGKFSRSAPLQTFFIKHFKPKPLSAEASMCCRWTEIKRLTFCPMSSSLSPNTWRLSECPRTTQSAPQSLIMVGLEGRHGDSWVTSQHSEPNQEFSPGSDFFINVYLWLILSNKLSLKVCWFKTHNLSHLII